MKLRTGNSTQVVLALVFGALAIVVLVGYWQLQSAAAAFRSTTRDLDTCRRLVGEIDSLKEQPQFAALDSVPLGSFVERCSLEC